MCTTFFVSHLPLSHSTPMSIPSFHDALFAAPWRSSSNNISKKVVMQRSGGSHFSECDDRIQLSVDLPGVKASDLDVKVENGVLTIAGTRKIVLEGGGYKRFRFEKNFSIDADSVDVAHMTANLSSGVLVLKAPKQKRAGPHMIKVTEDPASDNDEDYDDQTEKMDNTSKAEEKEDSKLPAKAIKSEAQER